MNCQNCGAKNEAEASFCAECGAPLEGQVGVVQPLEDGDDQTILSMPSQLADEEAKTVAVTQEEVAEAEAAAPVEPEPDLPPPPVSPAGGSGDGGGGLFTQRNIIIAVVVLLVLCCCCFGLSVAVGSSSEVFEEIIRELSSLPSYLYFV